MKQGQDGLPLEMSLADAIGQIQFNNQMVNVQSAPVAAASSGDNTIVAAVPGKSIYVIGFDVSGAGAVNAKWRNGTTDVTGAFVFAAAGARWNNAPGRFVLFQTAVGALLALNNSGAVAVNGFVLYFAA